MATKKKYKSTMKEAKQRLIYLYLPSQKQRDEWKELAEKANVPLTKFIIEHVENSINQEQKEDGYRSRAELQEDIEKLQEENKKLNKKLKMSNSLVDRLEEELRGYRVKPFLEREFMGYRKHEKDLTNLLKTQGEIRKESILKLLGINPMDTEIVKGVNKQLNNLERYGLIKDIGGKWRWKP